MMRRMMRRFFFMNEDGTGMTDRWRNMGTNFRRMLRRIFFIRDVDD